MFRFIVKNTLVAFSHLLSTFAVHVKSFDTIIPRSFSFCICSSVFPIIEILPFPFNFSVLHLLMFYVTKFWLHHFHILVASICRVIVLVTITLKSSAYPKQFDIIHSGRSIIKIMKNRGPSTEPCGTPLLTSSSEEIEFPTFARCFRPFR